MKKIDLPIAVDKTRWMDVFKNEKMGALGHLGTHFDVMNKAFSLDTPPPTSSALITASL